MLRVAQAVLATLEDTLGAVDTSARPISLELSDAANDGSGAGGNSNADSNGATSEMLEPIRLALRPESGEEQVAPAVTRAVLARLFGAAAAQTSPLTEGLAGYAACSGFHDQQAVTAWARAQAAAGKPLLGVETELPGQRPRVHSPHPAQSPDSASADGHGFHAPHGHGMVPDAVAGAMPTATAAPSASPRAEMTVPPGVADPAATAFTLYLIEKYGQDALRRFFDYAGSHITLPSDPTDAPAHKPRRSWRYPINEETYRTAFGHSLERLKKDWIASLRPPQAGALQDLLTLCKLLWPLVSPYKWKQLEVLAYMGGGVVTYLAIPYAIQYLTSHVRHHGSESPIVVISRFTITLLAVLAAGALISLRQYWVTSWISQRVLISLQEQLFARLQQLSHAFYAKVRIGDLMSRLSGDVSMVQQSLGQVINTGIYQTIVLISTVFYIVGLTVKAGVWWLGLVLIGFTPLFAIVFANNTGRFQKRSTEQQKEIASTTSFLQENLMAYPAIKALSLEGRVVDRYHKRLAQQSDAAMRLVVTGTVSTMSIQLMMALAQVTLMALGGYAVMRNPNPFGNSGMTVSVLAALTAAIPIMLGQVAGVAKIGQAIQTASGALQRVLQLLREPVGVGDAPGARPLAPVSREIKLEDVVFGYGGARPILDHLSMTVPAGKRVAIVGASGSGKSTVINLMMRFWDPESGTVSYDGEDARDVTMASLRGQTGLVFQETTVFDDTVMENIRLGKLDATDEEVIEASKSVFLHDDVLKLPDGYKTVLSERGGNISGGQRQRIGIARALLRQPTLLLLDEATSALDAATEAGIVRTLLAVQQGRTMVAITHRLALAMHSDWIFVLDDGKIVEQGPHDELIGAGGLYQKFYEEQAGGLAGDHSLSVEMSRLTAVPLLANIAPEALAKLATRLLLVRADEGAEIVAQGDPGEALYLLITGEAEVVVESGGAQRRVNVLRAGDFFGEMSILRDEPRSATVRALRPCTLYRLARTDFRNLLEAHPAEEAALLSVMEQRTSALR